MFKGVVYIFKNTNELDPQNNFEMTLTGLAVIWKGATHLSPPLLPTMLFRYSKGFHKLEDLENNYI